MNFEDLNKDVENLLKGRKEDNYKNATELKAYDPELFQRIKTYKDSGLMSKSDIEYMFDNQEFPLDSNSVLSKSYDSLKAISEKPVETPVEKPKEITFAEAMLPRVSRNAAAKNTNFGEDALAFGLDALSLIPRASIAIGPGAITNYLSEAFKGNTINPWTNVPSDMAKGGGVVHLPETNPASTIVNPVLDFVGDVAKGPIIPGGPLAKGASKLVPALAPSALKTALGVIGNAGVGAGLGTAESVARGEGVDATGAVIGAAIPLGLRGAQKLGNVASDRKSGELFLESSQKYIDDLTTRRNVAERNYNQAINNRISGRDLVPYKEEYDKASSELSNYIKGTGRAFETSPTKRVDEAKEGLYELAKKRGFIGEKPGSLTDALSVYTKPRADLTPTIPIGEISRLPYLKDVVSTNASQGDDILRRAAAGKFGLLPYISDIFTAKSYLPEQFINPVAKSAQVTTPPIIRSTNLLRDALSRNFGNPPDSTSR